jgi:choline dehydrogenase
VSGSHYDYVIAGAGLAGCVSAARLTERPDVRVLLLEAGGRDWNPLTASLQDSACRLRASCTIGVIALYLQIESCRSHAGGSSSINIMTFTRGAR